MRLEYTEDLLRAGKERERLTGQLKFLVDSVAGRIADAGAVGDKVTIGQHTVGIVQRGQKNDTTFLAIANEDGLAEGFNRVFAPGKLGGTFSLPDEPHIKVRIASREDYLLLANNLPDVVAAFQKVQDQIIEAMRDSFETLRRMAHI